MRISAILRTVLIYILLVDAGTTTGLSSQNTAYAANSSGTGTLLVEAYDSNGNLLNLSDFSRYTNYIADSSGAWGIYYNYGVFRVGAPPAIAQSGSLPYKINKNGTTYIAFTIPAAQQLYFTSLWGVPIPNTGTVFLRADNNGVGFSVEDGQTQILQLPYDFALSEFNTANRIWAEYTALGYVFSKETSDAIALASSQLNAMLTERSTISKAIASYAALATIIPLKESLILQISNHTISYRPDFKLVAGYSNYIEPGAIADFRRYKEAGFNLVHIFCNWNVLAIPSGGYDFTSLDFEINQATALGYKVVLSIMEAVENGTNQQYRQLSFDQLKVVYYNNAWAVVNRYKDNPAISVIYPANEMEVGTSSYSIEKITELTQQALQGARDADPSKALGIFFTGSGYIGYQMTNPPANNFTTWDFMKHLVTQNTRFDFAGVQMQYGTIFPPIDLQRAYENLVNIHNLIQKPIYIADVTFSSKTDDFGIRSNFYWHNGLTRNSQADWASGMLKIAYGNSWIKGMTWTHDENDVPVITGAESTTVGTGLFLRNGTLKPGYLSFKNFMNGIAEFAQRADCLFNWGESKYPSSFSPARPSSQSFEQFYYRYYSQTNTYIGVEYDNNHLYYLGPDSSNSLFDLGDLIPWYAAAACE